MFKVIGLKYWVIPHAHEFPGSIGHVMGGFGLEDVFELVYAANTVSYNGRWWISRSTHQLWWACDRGCPDATLWFSGCMKTLWSSYLFIARQIVCFWGPRKNRMMTTKTERLWIQYMEMVDIMWRFIRAEQTANWKLHLQSAWDMLPFFTASGHSLYAKSVYVYLQTMENFKKNPHPHLCEKYASGLHIVWEVKGTGLASLLS